MDSIKPIMVGRNQPQTDTAPNAVQHVEQAQTLAPLNAPQPAVAPVQQAHTTEQFAATAQPAQMIPEASTQAVTQTGGCMMYFNIKPVTRVVLEMPWGFISEDYICAFISSMGELVICNVPPKFNITQDVWVLDPAAKSIVLGKVSDEYLAYWRDSVSFRPDSGYSAEDVEELEETVEVPAVEQVEEKKHEVVDTVDYSHMSRNQRKRIKRSRLEAGEKLVDLPEALRDA